MIAVLTCSQRRARRGQLLFPQPPTGPARQNCQLEAHRLVAVHFGGKSAHVISAGLTTVAINPLVTGHGSRDRVFGPAAQRVRSVISKWEQAASSANTVAVLVAFIRAS